MNSPKKGLKIALIGPYPPPYGGISTHIQRLKEQLEERGYGCVVYDLGRQGKLPGKNVFIIKNPKRWAFKYLFTAPEDIIHCQSTDWRVRALTGLMGWLGRKTVLSIHGESLRDSLKKGNWFKKRIIKFAIRHIHFIIADNKKIENFVVSLGVDRQKVDRIAAFIPPTVKEDDSKDVPKYVWDFINSHKPVISANAFRIMFYEGVDLYGLDMIVELIAKLRVNYPEVGIVFCLPVIGDREYFNKLNQEIKEGNLNGHILFVTEPLDKAYPVWGKSDIFVRPTVTDGDSVSIREALFLKTPVVTSDAVPRPDGVVLFRNRDTDSFIQNVENVLADYNRFKKEAASVELESGVDKILEIYDTLAGRGLEKNAL